jgi:hypothetical protein
MSDRDDEPKRADARVAPPCGCRVVLRALTNLGLVTLAGAGVVLFVHGSFRVEPVCTSPLFPPLLSLCASLLPSQSWL